MLYTIENDLAKVSVDTHAAEIHSFMKKSDGKEMMWQGDPKFWAGRNPTLFPQVSNTYNKTQVFKGQEYHMGNHGLARHAEFEFVEQTENSLTLVFKSSEETYKQYPYHFALYITYTLEGVKLEISYRIENHDEEVMPFGFGLHPAFNVPVSDGKFEDYYVEFSSKERDNTPELQEVVDGKLPMTEELFEKFPSVIFSDLDSAFVKLTNGKEGVKVTFAGYKWLVVWSPKNAPFVCVEPWHSHGDFGEINVPFEQREGIINLGINGVFTTEYSIEIL